MWEKDKNGRIITTDEELKNQNIVVANGYEIYDKHGNAVPPQTFQEIVHNVQEINDKISATTASKEVFERQTNGNEAKTELENLKSDYVNVSKVIVNDAIQNIGESFVFYDNNFSNKNICNTLKKNYEFKLHLYQTRQIQLFLWALG